MSLFRMLWLRRLVRRYTNPIPQDNAEMWKKRLAIAYAIIAWNAFGGVCYMIYTGKADWASYYGLKSEEEAKLVGGKYFIQKLNLEKGTLVRLKGFSFVDSERFENLEKEKDNATDVAEQKQDKEELKDKAHVM